MALRLLNWSAIVLVCIASIAWGQIRTLQVTTLLNLDTSSYSNQLKTDYCNHFIVDLSLAISVDKSRFANPTLSSTDSSTSYLTFIILPPMTSSELTALQVYNAYNLEIHKQPESTFMNNELARHIDLTIMPQFVVQNMNQCSDGSYSSDPCPTAKTTPQSSTIDAINGSTLTIIGAVGGGIIAATIFLAMAIAIRRHKKRMEYQKTQMLQQQQPTGIVMAKIISPDDVIPSYQSPYRETQNAITTSFGAPPPYQQYSPPISTQAMPVQMMATPVSPQYVMTPVQQGYGVVNMNDPNQVIVDPTSMSTTTAKQSQAQPSRIVKKGMNLKQIRQKRIGLDAPQIDQGDESMPDTDTDF